MYLGFVCNTHNTLAWDEYAILHKIGLFLYREKVLWQRIG